MKSTTKNEKTKQFNTLYKQIVEISEEIEQEFLKILREERDNSPGSNVRNSGANSTMHK